MRLYSNYTPNEFSDVCQMAQELGFTPSAFQHYCVMLQAGRQSGAPPLATLVATMLQNLDRRQHGETFIVSSLLPDEWPCLSRSEKMTLAKQLARHVKTHPDRFAPYKVAKGSTTVYQLL